MSPNNHQRARMTALMIASKRRRGIWGLALALASCGLAQAAEPVSADSSDKGYSYFLGLGQESLKYEETSGLLPVKSSARATSALLIGGAVYVVDKDWLFSVDNATTFNPATSQETWTATSSTINGVVLSSGLLQTDSFNLSQSTTKLLVHGRLKDHWFGIAGPSFHTQTFRRFSFASGPDHVVNTPASTTVDESSSEILFNSGVGLESEQLRGQPTHYGMRAILSLPVWRRLQNTAEPQVAFNAAKGWDFSLEGRYSWAVHDRLQVGAWGRWQLSRRERQIVGGSFEMPANRLDGLGYGLELLWKL